MQDSRTVALFILRNISGGLSYCYFTFLNPGNFRFFFCILSIDGIPPLILGT